MTGRTRSIFQTRITKNNSSFRRGIALCCALLLLCSQNIFAQVISNNGAVISVAGAVVNSKDAVNNSGTISNSGTINLSGDYISTAATNGNGTFRIGRNWTNTGGLLSGSTTVIFNGSGSQVITRSGGEAFYNLSVDNSGALSSLSVALSNNVSVAGTLSMSLGNISAGTFKLFLSNTAAASLNYTSVTGSRIFGKFERGVGQAGTYLFPLGTSSFYNPAYLITNSVPSSGTVLSEFITPPSIDTTGLPFPDPPVEVAKVYQDGYWSLTASPGFSTGDFNINLNATGFTTRIYDVTRIIKRTASGSWIRDGNHSDADTINNIVFRNNLTGGISTSGSQFALGRARPLITVHPDPALYACENTNPSFSVTATGAGMLTYRWYKEPAILITNGPHYSGARTSTLTILGAVLSDAGQYYCIVTDRYGMSTRSNSGTLTVNRIPVATVTPSGQDHECSGIQFEKIVLGESYSVPLATFIWSRDNPSGITSTMPMSGSGLIIADTIGGSFTNTTDAPITVTFTIIPTGQAPTYCIGLPVTAYVTVNPTPRAVPVNNDPVICYGGSTAITLTTPSIMTNGIIEFDYTVSVTGAPGIVVGNTAAATFLPVGHQVVFPYQNNSDTIQSVYYSITPKNVASGCFSGPVVVPEVKIHPHTLQSNIIIVKPLTCEGGSDASLQIGTSKGAGPYYMVWDGPLGFGHKEGYGMTSLIGVPGGQYDVTVTDNHGCFDKAPSRSVAGAFIDSRMDVIGKSITGYGTTCPGSTDGEIWIRMNTSSTGIPPYDYQVEFESQGTVITGTLNTTGVYNKHYNLPPGNYRLFIKDSNGCYDINYPEKEIIAPDTIKVIFEKQVYQGGFNVSCLGYSDGSVSVKTITGGNGGYRYKWSKLNGTITGPDTLNRLDNISAGKYYLVTRDLKGCIKTDSVTLIEPSGIQLAGSQLSLSADGNYNVSCASGSDGFIKLNITGGSGVYTYFWTGPNGFTAATREITGLKAGTYSCVVADLNGCSLVPNPTYTLTQPAPLIVVVTTSTSVNGSHNINCFGGTGSINLTVTGGSVGTYKYAWSTADGSGLVTGAEDQNSLYAGTYHVSVTDLNNCEVIKDITLTQPQALVSKLTPTHITCQSGTFDNGMIDLLVTGGVAPFTYSWSNGATTQDLTGLTQGKYKVTVTDANGCTIADSTIIKLPPPLSFTKVLSDYNGYNVSCFGVSNGYIRINTQGGTEPFIFNWTGPDGFSSNAKDILGLKAGDYNLMITDSNLCRATETIKLTDPGKMDMIVSLSYSIGGGYNINCVGESTGTIGIQPVNNAGFVNYFWSDGSIDGNRINLPAGEYGLIITDMNNCHADSVITLTQPDSIKIEFIVTQPACPEMPDGAISLTVTGGVMGTDYLYRWSDNSTGSSISNIRAGKYKVFVTDMNRCTVKDSIIVKSLSETCLIIPNAISPDGDLINDVWNIGRIDLYPKCEIKLFNRWGEIIWRSETGYPRPWDGRSNGVDLPIDSYHYIIDLHDGSKPIIGNVTIVR
jgi:gliding motility-associated-like protein